ncbi:MAG: HU family DNA-binding protein [Candidatus Helarchaeota archaeon]
MIKADLINRIALELNVSNQEANKLVDVFLNIFKKTLENGEEIELRGFGNFRIRSQKSRPGRNPKTGETFPIPKKKIVKFKPSINLEIKE